MVSLSSHTPRDLNHPPPFRDINLYESDPVLQRAVQREGAGWAAKDLSKFGAYAGQTHVFELGQQANANAPVLVPPSPDQDGAVVNYDPAYHEFMAQSMQQGLHCSTWDDLSGTGRTNPAKHVARAAAFYMMAQVEAGHCCPITMTHAAVAALRHQPDVLENWLPKILSRTYDPAFVPVSEKKSATLGMGMTEIQGGSDVRANITRAKPVKGGGPGKPYLITGHKFFMSAPMSDAFLVLAQAPNGLSCFFMPRFRPDGSINALHIVQLKEKLGNRSNASAEVEFEEAHAELIGEEGRGVRTILEIVTLTRLDCAISSAALMRFSLAQAVHHCRHRAAFQKKLIDHPLMQHVLADMALHSETATLLAFRVARAYDNEKNETEAAWQRLMTPVAKYWICKAAPAFAYEAMECLGGNGYIEDASPLARVFREAPVNAIWEGSGNIMCLDVLRVLQREPETLTQVMDDLADAARNQPELETLRTQIEVLVAEPGKLEPNARLLTSLLGELAAGALIRTHAPSDIADAYLSCRLKRPPGSFYGATKFDTDVRAILDRALPLH